MLLTTVLGTVVSVVNGVVRNDDLLARWTFDEGNGTLAQDVTGNGAHATIYGNGQWGSGISRYALDLTANSGWAEAGPNDNLKAQEKYSIALWFKSSGSQQGWTQILSKRQEVFSPYFVQFDEGGDSLKVYHRFQADYVNSGTFPINHGVWNHLASTFDGQKFKSYLNGRIVGSVDETRGISQDNGILGIGGTPGGGDVFEGLIDDVRLYNVALSHENIVVAHGDGMGDFGPSVEINATLATHDHPIPVSIIFRDVTGNDANVSGFLETDIQVKGASVQNFTPSDVNASRYQFELIPDRNQTFVFITIPTGTAQDANGDHSIRATHRLNFNVKVTRVADLVGWWTFDETSGNIAADTSGGDANATVFGGAAWAGANAKFGTGALVLDGTDDYAMASALMTPDRITRVNDLLAYWPFDEGAGTQTADAGDGNRDIGDIGGATWTDGKFGKALSYNGGSTALPLSAHPPASGTEFSISFWSWGDPANLPGKASSIMESAGGAGRIINIHFPWNNSNVYWDVGDGTHDRISKNPGTSYLWGNWTHWVFIHNRATGEMKWYVNGALEHSGTGMTQTMGTPARWFLGSHNGGNGSYWYGKVDELRIYDVELSSFDVESIYREASGSPLDLGENDYTISTWFKPASNPNYVPGLTAGGLNGDMSFAANPGNLNSNTSNSGATNGIDPLGPSVSESKSKPPWKDQWTVVYSGQIYDDDGVMAFQEDIDDKAWLVVNGQQLLNDTGWNRETTGNTNFGTGGWFDFELRMSNGGGGAGRANAPTGFGWDSTGGTTWVPPRNSNANTPDLFRTEEPPNPLVARLGTSAEKGLFHNLLGRIEVSHALSDGSVEKALSSSGISLDEWHHMASVVNRSTGSVKLFVDGVLAGYKSFTANTAGEYTLTDWYFGSLGSSIFVDGILDDTRIYSAALSADDIANIYNGGEGDMGLMANFDAPLITNLGVIPITLSFSRFGEPEIVTGFIEGDITVTGATISNFQPLTDSSSYSFDLTPDANETRIELSLDKGAATANSDPSLPTSTTILLTPPVRKHGDIIGWWWFDDAKGTKVTNAVSSSPGVIQTGSDWSPNGKFGSAIEVNSLGGHVELGTDPGLSSADSFSVSFWFKRNVDSFSWSDNS
ncbi:MAG: LamG domain-containing protein, partial [Opitutae bacterium]|nr:LamG domain-containing protein [Opitutae bacterium]